MNRLLSLVGMLGGWGGCFGQGPSPSTEIPDVPAETAPAILERVIRRWALDIENPWAVKHAWLALGYQIPLSDGRPSIESIFTEYAVVDPATGGIRFPSERPRLDKPPIRIEPHTDLILKGLVESGANPHFPVVVAGKPFEVSDILVSRLPEFGLINGQPIDRSWDDIPWTLYGVIGWGPKEWQAGGKRQTTDEWVLATIQQLDKETAFLAEAIASHQHPEKRRQGIFAYSCGGMHLLEVAIFGVRQGYGGEPARQLLFAQIPIVFFRLDLELTQLDQIEKEFPEYRPALLGQKLRFLGHWLENVDAMIEAQLLIPDDVQKIAITRAIHELSTVVLSLEQQGIYAHLGEWKDTAEEQKYYDLVGDSAHALRGLNRIKNRFP